jgi:hypothetical protein
MMASLYLYGSGGASAPVLPASATPTLTAVPTFVTRTDVAQLLKITISNYATLNALSGATWTPSTTQGTVAMGAGADLGKIVITLPAGFEGVVDYSILFQQGTTATHTPSSASGSTTASIPVSATPTVTGATTATEGTAETYNVTPVSGASYAWSANEGSITPSGASAVWTPAVTGNNRNAVISCIVTEAGKKPSTAGTRTVAVSFDVLAMDGLIAYWDVSDPSITTTQLNQTFTPAQVNTTTGNLTVTLPFDTHTADPNNVGANQLATEVFFTTTGILPAPLAINTPYYIRKNTAGTEFEIYPKNAPTDGGTIPFTVPEEYIPPCQNFYLAVNKITLTTTGTGTHTVQTNPLLTTLPSKKALAMPFSSTDANLNRRVEVLTKGDGKKCLHGKGVLAKLRSNTTLEGVGKTLSLNFGGTDQTTYRELWRNKRYMYLVMVAYLNEPYIMDTRKNILAPSNVNVNGTITFSTHGFPIGTTGHSEVRCTATAGSTLPSGMPAIAYLRGVTANTYTLHPTMADAVANTAVITYGNTGIGSFIINSKTDVTGKPYEAYPLSVDFPVDYSAGSGNGTGSQRVIAFTQNAGYYGALTNAGPTNTQTPTLCDSFKRIAGIMNTGTITNLSNLPQIAYPVRVKTNGTYPLRTDATGGSLNPVTTYWSVPLNNSAANLCWLFDTKALADAWVSTSPTNSGNPVNGITLSNTDYYGRLQWYAGDDKVNMCQSNIIPSTNRTGLVPAKKRVVLTRVIDCDDPLATHWQHSLYLNTTPVYIDALFNNSDVRLKGMLNGSAIPTANILLFSPAQPHVDGELDVFAVAVGTSNTDPTAQLVNTFVPALITQFNVTP